MVLQNLSEKGTTKLILSREGIKDYIYCNTHMHFIHVGMDMCIIPTKIRLGLKKKKSYILQIFQNNGSYWSNSIHMSISWNIFSFEYYLIDMLLFYSLIFQSFKQYCSQASLSFFNCDTYTAIAVCCVQFINLRLKQGGKLIAACPLLAVPLYSCRNDKILQIGKSH